jgi:hypothetical protein
MWYVDQLLCVVVQWDVCEQSHNTLVDEQMTGADISYYSCVQIISNCDFRILRDYFIL